MLVTGAVLYIRLSLHTSSFSILSHYQLESNTFAVLGLIQGKLVTRQVSYSQVLYKR